MQQSAAPLLVFMIASIVALALSVHSVSADDPLYGSSLELGLAIETPLPMVF